MIQELLQVARKSDSRISAGFDVGSLVSTCLTDRLAAPPKDTVKGLENLGFLAKPGLGSGPAKGGGRPGGPAVHDRISPLH